LAFEPVVHDALLAVAKLLAKFGPQLGRPHVDTLNGSEYANMKELRFEALDGVWPSHSIRIGRLFCWSPGISQTGVRGASTANSLQKRTGGFLHTWVV
jgi:hypothetical protein